MRLLAALLGAILILLTASPADAAPSGRTVRLARTVGVDLTVPASGRSTWPVKVEAGTLADVGVGQPVPAA
ncbi:hypothetical protein OG777_19635 [Micromonospora peucetia]|uniref:hypothetical protein n=1 Tax=Micromonospora peucetia TaxID=47871 RepID=UPI00225A3573|nr:hypothetical protein [Micromonospora peucetia]MCX4389125.1 hypothetical protein [Micromonospora peucetia]